MHPRIHGLVSSQSPVRQRAVRPAGRTVRLPGNKTLQFRVDALNVFNNETYDTPNLNPTSTQFGMITANNGTYMRFVTFVTKFNF